MPYADPDVERRYHRIYARKWRAAHPERVKQIQRKTWQKNRLKILARSLKWKRANPKRVRDYYTEWKRLHPERCKENFQKWQTINRARRTAIQMKRTVLRRSVTVGDLTEIAKVYERAQWWRQWFNVAVDHIVPLARNGIHEVSNLQIIYAHENLAKRARADYKPIVVFL
jgi:hypothetical protein